MFLKARSELEFDVNLALHLRVCIDWLNGKPVVSVVVRGELLALDGDFAEDFVLLEMLVSVEQVDGDVAEVSGHFELVLLAEEGAERN